MSYIFLDESGIHKQDGVSTIALVYISVATISKIEQAVLNIEAKLKIQAFHWSHSSWEVRRKFAESISKENFSIQVALLNNPFRESTSYEYALRHLLVEQDISALIIDGKKNKQYERKIKKVLRDKGVSVRKLRTVNDRAYPALRIADLVAGIVRNKYENEGEKKVEALYKLISGKISLTIKE